MTFLEASEITHYYDKKCILSNISFSFEKGKIYSIIGPNGCGKSTLLKILCRQLPPTKGQVLLEGKNIYKLSPKKIAKSISLLSQQVEKVDITVKQLVTLGRTPHLGIFERLNNQDMDVVQWAISQTNLELLIERNVASLSGGEMQRVWLAMAIAQQPTILFLDEPTTYLDIAHQLELLELVRSLNIKSNVTIVMVLHDINHAVLYSDKIIAMKDGGIYDHGNPEDIMTSKLFHEVFGVEALRITDLARNESMYSLTRLKK
ncbi:ABC transporter ATP-binding protein [Niallia circulans]|uniref:ABC transporter ATP-binding protein n=1 Tax=Niallia circulans TaxID=1397 RepID=A0A941GJG6_NIACI|nr:ABC transporter ATP-binding protein [Niallia circulans]MCB5239155.1 ABC transporter ATP-binding protein [Niallia circulans]